MKQIVARAGERTKILHIFSDSIPQQVRFAATPLMAGEPVGGTVEVVRWHWFAKAPAETFSPPQRTGLQQALRHIDYAVFVTPHSNVRIAFQSRHFERSRLFAILGVVVTLGVIGALFALVAPLVFGR